MQIIVLMAYGLDDRPIFFSNLVSPIYGYGAIKKIIICTSGSDVVMWHHTLDMSLASNSDGHCTPLIIWQLTTVWLFKVNQKLI